MYHAADARPTLGSIAKQFGATKIDYGINWQFACGFPTEQAAHDFVNSTPMDHRGVSQDKDGTWGLRFRDGPYPTWHFAALRDAALAKVHGTLGDGI
jgi:hypothetical protein